MESAETNQTKMIQVVVNGKAQRVPEGLNIASLLGLLGIETSRVAVELDREIVRKPAWESTALRDGANVEVVWFVGGG